MDAFYSIIELLSVFAEGFIVFAVSSAMCERRYKTGKHLALLTAFSCIYVLLLTFIGKAVEITALSLVVAVACSFAVNYVLSKGTLLLRCTSLMTSWFFLHALDYVLAYGLMFVAQKLNSGENAYALLVAAAELIKIVIFSSLWKLYPYFRTLGKKYLGLLFAISFGAYILMYTVAGLIMGDSLFGIHMVSVFSILFTAVSLIATVFAVTVKTGYEKEKREAELMAMTNSMMEKNFLEMEASHNTIRQQVHDFKNHLFTIRGMLENDEKAKKYVNELLQVSYDRAQYSRCGNSVIDSIINCKAEEAKRQNISFVHRVVLTSELYLSSIDICAVLANQIDNAIEACLKLSEDSEKNIKVEIWQKASFVFFKVTNTCPVNPFTHNRELISTKNDPTGLHGYGIKNITRTAESYGGTVKSSYEDGMFISVAMLPNNK